MPIVYHPVSGMGFLVEPSEVKGYLAKGFRSDPPKPIIQILPADDINDEEEMLKVVPQAATLPPQLMAVVQPDVLPNNPLIINVNSASLKEITSLQKVGTASARKVVENRPYANIEDLIAKVELPNGNWMDLEHQICF